LWLTMRSNLSRQFKFPTFIAAGNAALIFICHISSAVSCVHTLEEALSALSPPPTAVHVSIVSQSVTVRYTKDFSPTIVQSALEDVGFDVLTSPFPTADQSVVGSFNGVSEGANEALVGRRRKHIEQCIFCQEALRADHDSSTSPGQGVHAEIPSRIPPEEGLGRSSHMFSVAPLNEKGDDVGPFRVVLSVGGMTCSSCSMTITEMVSDLQGVSDVVVSVLSGSAIFIVDDKSVVGIVVKTIEDCGFEAEIMSIGSLTALDHELTHRRTLTLRIDGMFLP